MNSAHKPQPKVAAAAAVGTPLVVVLAWLAGVLGLDVPAEVTAALAALVTVAVAYLTPGPGTGTRRA